MPFKEVSFFGSFFGQAKNERNVKEKRNFQHLENAKIELNSRASNHTQRKPPS